MKLDRYRTNGYGKTFNFLKSTFAILLVSACAFILLLKGVQFVNDLRTESPEKGVFVIQLTPKFSESKKDTEMKSAPSVIEVPKPSEDNIKELKNKKIIDVSKEDFNKIAFTVEQEAHDLSLKHKILIADVILNRVAHDKFPDTVTGVLTQKNQFQGYVNYIRKFHLPNRDTIVAVNKALKNTRNNILFFYNPKIAGVRPFFENNKKLTHVRTIEGHKFFAMR